MNNITLTISKADVYDEVAKTTSYTGAKMTGDADAYDRIFTTDEDQAMLDRFWTEACNGATEEFKQFITRIFSTDNGYAANLELSASFDTNLSESMEKSLFSYFVNAIVAKWFKFTNREEAESYGADAMTAMMDVKSKIFYRKKPKRADVPD